MTWVTLGINVPAFLEQLRGAIGMWTLWVGVIKAPFFAAIIAIPALGYFRLGMGSILAFWFAYVVTRPLGASVADWLGKPAGVGLGTGLVSVLFAAAIVAIVWHLARTGKDTPDDQFADPGPGPESAIAVPS